MLTITLDDLTAMAQTIHGEARNQPYKGMVAVGKVIVNRWNRQPEKSIWEIVHARKQFSCWNDKDPNLYKIGNTSLREMLISMKAAIDALTDLTAAKEIGLSRHYHVSGVVPYWAEGKKPKAVIGDHIFYEDIP